ncbi:PEP-CTERM domain protein [Oopsacas minuta]|uniref:PEP-CTERM domain protein n=1 Tax=Oopsacas minuta TaxID=111878 RepID=A0AAV7K729_9METZ|nr:PEP-CTERM domain protein [Oopsacas minuta]
MYEFGDHIQEIIANDARSFKMRSVTYKSVGNPKIVAGVLRQSSPSKPAEFNYPESIAIDYQTNDVYVCDKEKSRVQVFSENLQFLFQFNEGMDGPSSICIGVNRIYITHSNTDSVTVYSTDGRLMGFVGGRGYGELKFRYPTGIAVSKEQNIIYICDYWNNRIQCLNFNLSFHSYIEKVSCPSDIKLTLHSIVVLVKDDPHIRFYDYSHQLIRQFYTRGEGNQLIDSWHFFLDREFNILMTDRGADCVLIYSNTGDLIHRIFDNEERKAHFNLPEGIAVDSHCRIIVISRNVHHCIQVF